MKGRLDMVTAGKIFKTQLVNELAVGMSLIQ